MDQLDSFNDIYAMLDQVPGLASSIGMEKGMAFVRIATRLRDEIISKQKAGYDPSEPPKTLPDNVHDFLGSAVDIPTEYVQGCWTAFAQTIWQRDANGDSQGEDAKLFRQYGLHELLCKSLDVLFYPVGCLCRFELWLATRMLFPPTRICTNHDCTKQGSLLRRKDEPRKVVLFTLGEGACPTYSIHLVCHGILFSFVQVPHPDPYIGCNTNYHHDYTVKDNVRTYYGGVPDVVHVGDHQFVERKVLNL